MAESVDAADLKSAGPKGSCQFESGLGYKGLIAQLNRVMDF